MWGAPRSFPRAIVHVDGDGFFAACEVAKNPSLRGKPVITGKERGIVSACTYEAKALGIKRGMQLHEVRRICPDAVILPSDYETYSLFSERMYAIVRRFTPAVDEYGIDECFGDLTGLRRVHRKSYPSIAADIKSTLEQELGLSFSVGLSATKTLAKIGSKWQKPSGLTAIPLSKAPSFLAKLPASSVWGIGPNTAAYLEKFGIRTALDFAGRSEAWVRSSVSKPYVEVWRELNGEVAIELDVQGRTGYQSISKTKTFTPPSSEREFIFSQLSKNIENACIKARRWRLAAPVGSFFLKTQDFTYAGRELRFPYPTNLPQDVLAAVREVFDSVYRPGVFYRATGITLAGLESDREIQLDLFGTVKQGMGVSRIYAQADALSEKYGKHAVFLGSSFRAMRDAAHRGDRGDAPTRTRVLFKGESARRRLDMPFLGEV